MGLEDRVKNQEHLMDTHSHKGGASVNLDLFDEEDTSQSIEDNEYIFGHITASDTTKLEDATEHVLDGSDLEENIYTIRIAYPGTIRIKYDGKREVTNAWAKIYIYDIEGGNVTSTEQFLNLGSYVSYSEDFDVKIGYSIGINLRKAITPAKAYLKNFEVCYDITKDQGTSFI